MKGRIIKGFSKLTEDEKRKLVASLCVTPGEAVPLMESFLFSDEKLRELFMDLSENTISSFHLPYGIAPNFIINGNTYHVPMVIEESSVIAAAASSARFWAERGGFNITALKAIKLGHVYFRWFRDPDELKSRWLLIRPVLLERLKEFTANMERRGGGVSSLELLDDTYRIDRLFRLKAEFETVDSMGANFINTCLEELGKGLAESLNTPEEIEHPPCQIVMSILSNYTNQCVVTVEIACERKGLKGITNGLSIDEFAEKVALAYQIAFTDTYRATTHNKGIMNGVDAVLIATGNDFRAAEAAAHTFASRSGQYRALSRCELDVATIRIILQTPMSVGTVGGITNLHPLARMSLEILGNPDANELMGIVASVGLASNFSAISSLVTTGIQKGHMKLHITNILNILNAEPRQRLEALDYFEGKTVSFAAVKEFLDGKYK
jgi:hydroxymethylglutaryl-CoA reductase